MLLCRKVGREARLHAGRGLLYNFAGDWTSWGRCVKVPQEALLNQISRSEIHLLRNIERDENALERMQRRRLGEKVPPPSARVD